MLKNKRDFFFLQDVITRSAPLLLMLLVPLLLLLLLRLRLRLCLLLLLRPSASRPSPATDRFSFRGRRGWP